MVMIYYPSIVHLQLTLIFVEWIGFFERIKLCVQNYTLHGMYLCIS